jgi:outer membrane protein assembly factor BamB
MHTRRTVPGLVVLVALCSIGLHAQSADWPQWRGPARDGAASAFRATAAWPEALTERWTAEVGLGYATPLVVGDRVYVFSRLDDLEVLTALDADTGALVWRTDGYRAEFTMQSATRAHGPGPKSTPVYWNGRLYTIGMTGVVTGWDAGSGRQLWQQRPGELHLPQFTTHAFSPLVENGAVIFHVGGHDNGALIAFDAASGDVRWTAGEDGPGYGSPVLAEVDGTRQIVTITQRFLVGVEAATGRVLWQRSWESPNVTNSITPLVFGDMVVVSGNGPPTSALRIVRKGGEWTTEAVWENEEVPMRMTSPVLADGVIYGLSTRNSGHYFALDARSGRTLWTSDPRQATNASLATAGPWLLSLEDDGELVVARLGRDAFEVVRRYRVSDTDTWTQAAYSGNRIFVKGVSDLTLWTVN